MPIKYILFSLSLLFLPLLTGCSSTTKTEAPVLGVVQLYEQANDQMSSSNYRGAIETYNRLIAHYPQGQYSEQAQLEVVYANYMAGEFAAAGEAAGRFIQHFPAHANIDYAHYLRALTGFEQGTRLLARRQDPAAARTGQTLLRESFNQFRDLIMRFPDSRYGQDAVARMSAVRGSLARHEIVVAADDLRRGLYEDAVRRGQYVVQHFPQTTSIPDALAVLVQAYRQMDQSEQAENALRQLQTNHPDYRHLPRLKAGHSDVHVGD